MKKLLLLVATVFCCSLVAKAATVSVVAGENALATAVAAAASGDVLELGDGAFTEWNAITLEKQLTIKAAEGAKPVIKIYSFKFSAGSEGSVIDGLEVENLSNDNYLFRTGGNVAGSLTFKNCVMHNKKAETTNPTSYFYLSSNTVETLTIDNCIFTDNDKTEGAIVYGGSATVTNFSMTNSTAYNMPNDLAVRLENLTNAYVDHCTFYNCGTRVLYLKGMTTSLVQNCIVANPVATSNYCIASYAGDVKNVIYYNTTAPRSGSTNTDCVEADPKFKDAANADFTLMEGSPALTAGTDGKAIGDPRWTPVPSDPATLAEVVAGKTIRRAVASNDGVYVLAVDAAKAPTLVKADFEGNVVTAFATDFCTAGSPNARFVLSDIALTEDGVLLGCNADSVLTDPSSDPKGANIKAYKWAADGTGEILFTFDAYIYANASWTAAFSGETMAYHGTLADGQMIMSGVSATGGNKGRMREIILNITNGAVASKYYNKPTGNAPDAPMISTVFGDNMRFNAFGEKYQVLVSGSLVAPRLLQLVAGETNNGAIAAQMDAAYTGISGFSFAKKADKNLMVIPAAGGATILNVTAGLNAATSEKVLSAEAIANPTFMYAAIVADGAKVMLMRDANIVLLDLQDEPVTGLSNIENISRVRKAIMNGQLMIIREGVMYNIQGQIIR